MRSMYLRFCLIGILFCTFLSIKAQTSEWINLHKGNVAFKSGDMATAEKAYRQVLKENPRNARAAFNLGDVYLSNKDAQNALKYYSSAAKLEKSKVVRAMAYHNMGYIHQVSKNYDRAIGYYKEALRNNPEDNDTRYNLVLCQKQKKQEDQNKQNNQKNNRRDNSDKSSGKGQNPQQPDQKQQSKNHQLTQNSASNSGMSKDNAEQLLNLSRQSEQQTRRKVENAQHPRPKQLDKNW